ncbi:uncharacterized protein LOC119348531 [Triticum dicoccoides]|uniref:uncharacterized protein LOC119339517 n=1 Tax=Triticum dicoccoides TaxID=85692 RepID=UPI00188FA3BA|nr:uncharacterized protein LOC119339517 [Triticum dicoccoides]XP_037470397.1 uncharacterized protein LOC119343651 [Triticum dicoccoides]XP_037470510.1 uncharacterized protein LOC119343873 [Triticum dicoccoides]XP_037472483.1 uncharacterized protein LOC119348531 [Triticum dicoccoides]
MQRRCGVRRRSARLLALGGGGPDLISALPEDLLLLILARLPCASAAARTGLLSRRWRSLWPRLRQIVFRDVPLRSLEAVLGRLPRPPPVVCLLHIRVPKCVPKEQRADEASVKSLLRAAALLEPEKFVFELPSELVAGSLVVNLPLFHRATSIVLDLRSVFLRVPAGAEFTALEALSLSYCTVGIGRLLSCCPRLRKLCLARVSFNKGDLTVKSSSLQELLLEGHGEQEGQTIDIETPALKQLIISFSTPDDISVLAPMVEMVWWNCYFRVHVMFDLWRLQQVTLMTAEGQGQLCSLHIDAYARLSFFHGKMDAFTEEIEKHMIVKFSVLELRLATNGHGFGALVFHLLGMNRIRRATRRLRIALEKTMVNEECPFDCPCEPEGWRSNTISLTALEEVEINGFGGDDHEHEFLKLIFKCAPMLKRMIVKLSDEASSSNYGCTEVYNIFKACSSVEVYVYLSSGLMLGWQNCPLE